MTKFLSLLVPGAVSGALYAVIGVGLVLGYQTAGIFNFGYGAVAFTAAYLYYQLNTGQHLPILWSAAITVLVFAPLMGFALERIMLRRLAAAPVYARNCRHDRPCRRPSKSCLVDRFAHQYCGRQSPHQ